MSSKKKLFHLPGRRCREKATDKLMNNSTRGSLCRRCSRNSCILPRFHPLSFTQHRPGADGMQHHNMLYNLDLTLLELPDSTKGGAKGHVVRGAWAGSSGRPGPFSPNYSLVIPGPEKGATSWTGWKRRLLPVSVSFEIDAKERHYKTLLTARNLMAVVRESQEYVVNILPRKMPKEKKKERRNPSEGSRTETRRTSPPNKAPAKKRKLVKNGKGVKEPTPPKVLLPPITHEAEVIIEEPVNPAPHSISSGSGHVAGLNHSSTSLAAVARLANLAEEAASINHPDSPNPDVDAVEAGPPSKRPRSARNLRSGLIGRLQDRQQEMKLVAHPPTTLIRRGRSRDGN
ncbi:hypothetical protein CK203_111728 [Vitis vinifera]|uniref:Uncharacterized protein n=1 Tax=Vitis vinifera TaxID=29760 RepID=A0A438FF63_VITVI|nr:hypothetical protein CK203_111728 [Vitis vinifera]